MNRDNLAAIDGPLARYPRDIAALIAKADHLAGGGDLRAASAYLQAVQSDPSRRRNEQAGMADNPDWSAFYLWKDGATVSGNAERCPRTLAALAGVPFTRVRGRMPSILFSVLRPGAHIPAHNGFINARLICHLPLVVPTGCAFRV